MRLCSNSGQKVSSLLGKRKDLRSFWINFMGLEMIWTARSSKVCLRVMRQRWLRVPHASHLQGQSHPSACKGWILAWVQPQGQISWVPVAGRRRCSHCPKTGLSPSWPLPAPSGGYRSLGSTWFWGKKESDWIIVYRVLTIFIFGIICKLHRCDGFFKKKKHSSEKSSYDRSDFISAEFYET